MAVEKTDRTTMDLFATEKRRGRPRSNPLPRKEQLRVNKRNQIQRDRTLGLKRIELKVSDELYTALNEQATLDNVSRGQLIESILLKQFQQVGKADETLSAAVIDEQIGR
ncbi:LexA regulated protein [Ferrimonas sp. SCSIO 43195]|uniref:LexA regulated protein n=2 Tax=Ferrimonas TaxID=44011 RepID=UPI00207581C0|nr:LexA regulated protein [Ferrimonas sp. SCSIO 43195]USD36306.1 LexA regulated protein [Ferrimonas sp. SCSIO 43195]